MLAPIDNVPEDDGLKIAVLGREGHARHALHQHLVGQAMRDEVAGDNHWYGLLLGEFAQRRQRGHRAVVIEDRAQRRRGPQPGAAHQVDRALGASQPHHDAAGQRHQRQNMPRHDDIGGGGFRICDNLDSARAVGGRDACGDALARLDQRARLFADEPSFSGLRKRDAELAHPLFRDSDRDDSASLARHEIDVVGSDEFGRHHEVAFGGLGLLGHHQDHLAFAQTSEDFVE